MKLIIDNQLVGLAELREAWHQPITIELGIEARRCVAESNAFALFLLLMPHSKKTPVVSPHSRARPKTAL